MSAWNRVFAALYDRALRGSEEHGLAALRGGLLAGARGRTLELGAGTGLNLEHIPPAVTELVLTEPDPAMAQRLRRRVADSGRDAAVVAAGAEALPFGDASFDTVVSTLVLCTVADLAGAVTEARRVLAPGGRLLLLEHVRHPDAARARWQRRLTPLQRRVACGCHLDRATPEAIRAAGFAEVVIRQERFPQAPAVMQPLAIGSATR